MEVAAHDDHVTRGVSTPSATATATVAGSRGSRSNRPNASHNERTRVGAILPILGLMMACSTPIVGAGGTKRKQCDNQEYMCTPTGQMSAAAAVARLASADKSVNASAATALEECASAMEDGIVSMNAISEELCVARCSLQEKAEEVSQLSSRVKELENENNSLKFALSMNKLALKRLTADFAALEKKASYKMAKATNAMSSGGRYSSTSSKTAEAYEKAKSGGIAWSSTNTWDCNSTNTWSSTNTWRNTRWNKGTWVVQVEQYDKCEKGESENDSEQQYRLGKQRCKSWLCNCGVNAEVPCHKQHRSVYKACNIREPLGFKISVPQRTMQTKAKKVKNARSTYVAYCMSPGVEQSIQNNLDPAHVQVEK